LVKKSIILSISMILLNIVFGYGQVHLEPVCADSIEAYGVKGSPGSIFVWDVEGGEIISDDPSNDTIYIKWGNITGNDTIVVYEYTTGNCSNMTYATIIVRAPYVDLGYDHPEICQEDSLVLNVGNNFQEPYEITWSNPSNNNSEEYVVKTTQKVWVRVIDGFGCGQSDTVFVKVNPLPIVNFGRVDTFLCDVENPMTIYYNQIMQNPGEFSQAYWKLGDEESYDNYIIVHPAEEIVDTLIAIITDVKGCVNSDTMSIIPCDPTKLFLEMPNSITPNGDGNNDVWNIPYMNIFTLSELEIFDRWGRLVYRTENVYEEPWDGKSKGRPLPMDSYYYVLKLNFQNAKPIVGTVNLIK
jgi:gliding motility-associated-like protein